MTDIDANILERVDAALALIEKKYAQLEETGRRHVDHTIRRIEEKLESTSLAEKVDAVIRIVEEKCIEKCINLGELSWKTLEATIRHIEERYDEFEKISLRDRVFDTIRHLEELTPDHFIKTVDSSVDYTAEVTKAALYGAKRLLEYEELPRPWQHNEHITSGYRFLTSKTQCLLSVLQVHNETGNIWTHLLGVFLFCWLGYHSLNTHLLDASYLDRLVFFLFFAAAAKCLICSTLFHTFQCHSRLGVMRCSAVLDYVGISLLITASVLIIEYYGFYCRPIIRNLYLTSTIVLGVTGVILPWFRWFDHRDYRYVRIMIFVLMGASGFVPFVHMAFLFGWSNTWAALLKFIQSIACYLLGTLLYANHYPEKLWPGAFNLWGHSHQLWHLCVLAGIYYHYVFALNFYQTRCIYGCNGSCAS
ncbi:HlyIII-domain-containing protein [Basidiobolus meristosporus CBS 931.73]|uniref:HlyIII-domain-containing protein n=1 Tax=Basidiobolus meristosporus CBS 931.73 TaxID=1314790 RepID=A0A1Y1YIY6_9FUNG|nr:HlyIII-domain-containing protein [Basidiobolus meristosporus CBS 931.73]|eukprot:ORX97990.1 HlyIII-domain-containing protein [Basidiobolus meristosporus CBS 931.73]